MADSATYSKNVLTQRVHPVIVFLCTPRCGTQWLAKNLGDVYADTIMVEHEPIKYEYYPKVNLGGYDLPADERNNFTLNEHLDFIDGVIEDMSYIEIGWEDIAGIPEFYKRFGERLRLIHLYRNPVNVAASMVTHRWYTGEVKERYEKAELNPHDSSAILYEYKSMWDKLTLFEKSLYYWTEINLRALEVKHRYPRLPLYSLKFENLFTESKEISRMTLIELLAFMDLNYSDDMLKALERKYDNYRSESLGPIDWEQIFKHPQTIVLANKLGYQFEGRMDLRGYQRTTYRKIIRKITSLLNRFRSKKRKNDRLIAKIIADKINEQEVYWVSSR